MGRDFYETSSMAREIFERVQQATGTDIHYICFEAEADELKQTQNAQLALYTCGCIAWEMLRERVPKLVPFAMAGHSVGEYAALTAAGILSLEEGARLVRKRGDLMARSGKLRPGGMIAVLGVELSLLEDICKRVSPFGTVVVANHNCPGQYVISGDQEALERWVSLAKESGVKKIIPLNVSGAFHSPLMEESAEVMGTVLATARFIPSALGVRVYSNVTAEAVEEPTCWPELLESQLKSPVLWVQSIQNMIRDGVHTFIECGSGEVLCGLVRRIDPNVRTLSVRDVRSLEETAGTLVEELK
jgi:[acyl-carrier-protein] S-malonyltransferase